jgi:hypothetical protein
MKQFNVVAVDAVRGDTSEEVVLHLSAASKQLEIVKTLLDNYPDANSTVTANYYSDLFEEFQKYHPSGIVQYSVFTTRHNELGEDTSNIRGPELMITIIFDRYYDYNSNSNYNSQRILKIMECKGANYRSMLATELPIENSEIEKC